MNRFTVHMKSRTALRLAAELLLLVTAAGLPGCATEFDLRKGIPWESGKDGKFETPMQVVAFWTDAVQNETEKPKGIRGFGGRLYFYGKDPNKPVKVKGNLVIYAFDETNRDPKNVVPDKKYVFTPEQFQKKYSKSSLGDSYSIWLPWDEVGGPQKQISLVVRFTSEKGQMITSDEAHQVLPGSVQDKAKALADQNGNQNVMTLGGQPVTLSAVPPMPFGAAGTASNVTASMGAQGVQPAAFQQPAGTASGVQAAVYQQQLGVNPSQPNTFSVMQASTGAAVTNLGSPTGPDQSTMMIDPSGQAQPQQRMSTTTIAVPQVPRPHLGMQNVMPMQSASMNTAMPNQMMGQMPGVMQNQIPVQTMQAPVQMPVQMPQQVQGPLGNSGTVFAPGQMQVPTQTTPVQNLGGALNPMGPQAPGLTNRLSANGSPAQAVAQTANEVRSGFDRPRALGAPIARLDSDRGQWQPFHGESQSIPPSAPQSVQVQ
jgi:hypothetical protein